MLGGSDVINLHEMVAQGKSIRQIARETGYSRNTIRKWLKNRELPVYGPRQEQPSKLDPFKDYLKAQMAKGVFNCNRLYHELKSLGYAGGKTILKDWLKPFRLPSEPPAVMRFETSPGEQAQVDFSIFAYEDETGRHRLYAFVMVLSYSRAMYVEFVSRQDAKTFIRCHINAFNFFGGIPRTILYDNLKSAIYNRDDKGQPILQQEFAELALICNFKPRFCRPYRAKTKGRVERANQYIKGNFWPGVTFTDLKDLNSQVLSWCQAVANQRIHGTTGLKPCDLFREENLRQLPHPTTLMIFLTEQRKVSLDGFVSYDGNRYGVPWQVAGRTVNVLDKDTTIEIYDSGKLLASHRKASGRNRMVYLPGQWAEIPMNDSPSKRTVVALKIKAPEVEVRPLTVYELLAGGDRP